MYWVNLVKPELYFLSQFWTFGKLDLYYLEIIYIEKYIVPLYLFIECLMLPFTQIGSLIWMILFWYMYATKLYE